MQEKLNALKENIAEFSSAVIAFSGGVDSTFLAAVARQVLPGKVLLVTANSSFFPQSESEQSARIAQTLDVPHLMLRIDEQKTGLFATTSRERCYYCKRAFFEQIRILAARQGYSVVMDGSNVDDLQDYRPGLRALKELDIRSPLCETAFSKKEIREFSRQMELPTAEKPSMACLVSRFPYGENITKSKLRRVELSEEKIRALGIHQLRVRSHDNLARIEVDPCELGRAFEMREEISEICTNAGFTFVSLDLDGYRSGAMN